MSSLSKYEECKLFREKYEALHGSVDADMLTGNSDNVPEWVKYGFVSHYMQGYEDAKAEFRQSLVRFSYDERDDGK